MKKTYSLYEAKARLSEIIRLVRENGESVMVSYHGRPVAEIRPVDVPSAGSPLEQRLAEMKQRGVISERQGDPLEVRAIAKKPGALKRFLEERD